MLQFFLIKNNKQIHLPRRIANGPDVPRACLPGQRRKPRMAGRRTLRPGRQLAPLLQNLLPLRARSDTFRPQSETLAATSGAERRRAEMAGTSGAGAGGSSAGGRGDGWAGEEWVQTAVWTMPKSARAARAELRTPATSTPTTSTPATSIPVTTAVPGSPVRLRPLLVLFSPVLPCFVLEHQLVLLAQF